MTNKLTSIGGGLAGCEAAWQAAQNGVKVSLYEMRPTKNTPAHQTDGLAELVCSNSLGSKLTDRATGLLQEEMRRLDSIIMKCAEQAAVPAGGALAVDRDVFSKAVTDAMESHPNITLIRKEITEIPDETTIVASGPLTSDPLAETIREITSCDHLAFFDAMAPIVEHESINMDIAYRASRYDRGETEEGDYINCPLNKEQYEEFRQALIDAEKIELRDFEREDKRFFEGCLPVEELAQRSDRALAFGPLKPKGLDDPRTGRWPHAVVQLRQDNLAGSLYNMVGFQTNLKWAEQKRVFRMIPGLENAEFIRFGQMHRNTFLNAPELLLPTMQLKSRDNLFFAGQLTGVEGYIGNAASGLVAGRNAARKLLGKEDLLTFPVETMLGALLHYITHCEKKHFQPMKANFGILPTLPQLPKGRRGRRDRYRAYADRALKTLETFCTE